MRAAWLNLLVSFFLSVSAWGCSDDSVSPTLDETPVDIQSQVDSASVGDTILIDAGIYSDLHEYTNFKGKTIQVFCVVKPGVVVRGATGNPADVIIDAGKEGYGFWFHGAGDSTELAALTVRNALWAVSGYDSSPRIDHCIFEANGDVEKYPTSSGAGIYLVNSQSIITDCTFQNNKAQAGAGAAFTTSSTVYLQDCEFFGNHATYSGGGMSLGSDCWATLVDCYFIGNSADRGGGIHCLGRTLQVTGGWITGNSAVTRGGGVSIVGNSSFHGQFERVVLLDNEAPEAPQGYVTPNSGAVNVICCEADSAQWIGDVTFETDGCDE